MKLDQLSNIDVANPVSVGKAKRCFVLDILANTSQSPAGHGRFTRIDQGDFPRLCFSLMHPHFVSGEVERNIRHMQKIVSEIFLDQVTLIAAANHEIVESVGRINLHDVPDDGLAAYFNHWLGSSNSLFANAGAESTR